MNIKKGDTILISTGKDRGRTGKVLNVSSAGKILVEGINLKKNHVRPKKSGEKGQIVKKPGPMDISNVKLVCPECKKATRVGYKKGKDFKKRICKKCKAEI